MKVPVGIGYLQKMQNNYGKKGSKQGHPVSRSIDSTLFLLFILLSSIANLNTDFTNKKLTYILSKKKKGHGVGYLLKIILLPIQKVAGKTHAISFSSRLPKTELVSCF